jgi:hypothetical protein
LYTHISFAEKKQVPFFLTLPCLEIEMLYDDAYIKDVSMFDSMKEVNILRL